jgi:hypothetical protein
MRASYSEVVNSALNKTICNWYKYFDNSFSQSSLTGSAQDILPYIHAPGWMHAMYSQTLEKTVAFITSYQNTRDFNLIYDTPFDLVNTETDDECYAIFSDDGFNWSFPEKVSAFVGTSSVYSLPLSIESHKGELSDQFKVVSMPVYWSSPDNISYYHNATVQPFRDVQRSFSISKYTQPYKIPKAIDRGQLHPFIATIHYIGEQRKLLQASAHYFTETSSFDSDNRWANLLHNRANSLTESSGSFPNSFNDYVNFELGRDLHKLYYEYNHNFNNHRVSKLILDQNGPNILAHSLGSLLYNSDFTERGSLTLQNPALITTNIASTINFVAGEGIFSQLGTTSGTYIASSILNIGQDISEFRNSGILSHIEFCQPSGASDRNNFAIIDIDPSLKSSGLINPLLHNNVLIKQSAYAGLGRIIFDISKYQLNSEKYDVQTNFLTPEHEFNVKFKTTLINPDGLSLGGGTIGVWIHTKPELNKVWTYTPQGTWINHSASGLDLAKVVNYSHLINIPYKTRDITASSNYQCLKFLDQANTNRGNDVIASLREEEFTEISLNLHTRNYSCEELDITRPTEEYINSISNNVHRTNQNYVIEIFTIPTQDDKFTLYYGLSMVDLTLNRMSKPLVAKLSECKELRIDLSKDQLLNIIKYFNQIRGEYSTVGYNGVNNLTGYASRIASTTQGFYETSGGSRINYVVDSNWGAGAENGYALKETINLIN